MDMKPVLVFLVTVDLLQIADLNVSSIQNVLLTKHVSSKNVEILVSEHVDSMLNVMWLIIMPSVHVLMITRVILSLNATRNLHLWNQLMLTLVIPTLVDKMPFVEKKVKLPVVNAQSIILAILM